jgi:hypothetical protein
MRRPLIALAVSVPPILLARALAGAQEAIPGRCIVVFEGSVDHPEGMPYCIGENLNRQPFFNYAPGQRA